ncbi:arylsulfatase, partial [Klebsiella aerogenes]
TRGALSGKAGEAPKEEFKINGQYVNTPVVDGKEGVVGIPFFDRYVEKASLDYLEANAKSSEPFFMSINFMKNHQPNMPDPDYVGKSMSKSKYADSMVEMDARVGHIMDKLRELGIDKNTLVVWTTDNGAWQDVYPDAGYTPFRGTKGTDREGGSRVPAIAWWPGKIKEHSRNHDIVGGLDLMATFASVAGIKLPTKDRAGQPIIFDSYDISYVATVPQIFDLWQDPQERYDIFMNNYTEHTWTLVTFNEAITKLMKTYVEYPPRKPQSEAYSGPITLSQ